tara:strand:- start:1138 stop:1698 length:561 start_codon:yes stop_codon:yes gene_type:complete
MAITGTKVPQQGQGTLKNYFVNDCRIDSIELVDSPYHDCSVHLRLTDTSNEYNYNLFVNQNFKKDKAGVVQELAYPDNLNLLYLHTDSDLNVSDNGTVNIDELTGKEIAVINYLSNGKYKKQTWQRVGSTKDHGSLAAEFEKSVGAGYPKDFIGYEKAQGQISAKQVEEILINKSAESKSDDGLPF